MTNMQYMQFLSPQKQEECKNVYMTHPLAQYIDWDAFLKSENGNSLDFLKRESEYTDENNNKVYVLDTIVENNECYSLVFICGENTFHKIPKQ